MMEGLGGGLLVLRGLMTQFFYSWIEIRDGRGIPMVRSTLVVGSLVTNQGFSGGLSRKVNFFLAKGGVCVVGKLD